MTKLCKFMITNKPDKSWSGCTRKTQIILILREESLFLAAGLVSM